MNQKTGLRTALEAAAVTILVFLLSFSRLLYSFDRLITDPLYQIPDGRDNRIMILAIDEKTISAYGDIGGWSREIPARLVQTLMSDPNNAPAVIAFDIMFISEREAQSDADFADACAEAGNVLTAANLVSRTQLSREGDSVVVHNNAVSALELPYPALREVSDCGFANTYLDQDQFVRYSLLSADWQGEQIWSLSAATALRFAEQTGVELTLPKTDSRNLYEFRFSGRSGAYEHVSLCDVLEGDVRPYLNGRIVLVGAYAPGMQDAYSVPVQRGSQMYGVEIHANILEALLEGKTALPVDNSLYAVLTALFALVFFLLVRRMKIIPAALCTIVTAGLLLLAARQLYLHGHVVRVIEPLLAAVLLYLLRLVGGYIAEWLKRRKILNAFKKYVAPQVVDEVSSKGDFSIRLGGEKRNIAVLFVDIRGFTPMSEGLQPEEVVEILNEYLSLATRAIFQNGGTLDKFIGDAAMAVFNAPFDLDDYVYHAVCTARDIAAGSEELEKKLMERFGRSVSFGIGVNCGDAVVGNIGSEFRMDYTAIGDTVNTAARLESNAGRGQILISQSVYEAVKDRVSVTEL